MSGYGGDSSPLRAWHLGISALKALRRIESQPAITMEPLPEKTIASSMVLAQVEIEALLLSPFPKNHLPLGTVGIAPKL